MGVEVSAVADRTTGWQHAFTNDPTHIVVAAHPSIHLDVAHHATMTGLPLFLEKPAALCLADVERMAEMPIPITVDYLYLFATEEEVKQMIDRALASLSTGTDCHEWGPLYDWGPHLLACAKLSGLGEDRFRSPLERALQIFLDGQVWPAFDLTVLIHRRLDAIEREKETSGCLQ
jgi:hypothetical protein